MGEQLNMPLCNKWEDPKYRIAFSIHVYVKTTHIEINSATMDGQRCHYELCVIHLLLLTTFLVNLLIELDSVWRSW